MIFIQGNKINLVGMNVREAERYLDLADK